MRTLSPRAIFLLGLLGAGLAAAGLACSSSAMQAKDQPVWLCPTATLDPDCFVTPTEGTPAPEVNGSPAGAQNPTFDSVPPGGSCQFEQPYQKTSDFPLGRSVIVGAVGGYGMGVWASMDHVRIAGPFTLSDPVSGESRQVWVVSWQVSVTNGSLSNDYEFYPLVQLYVLDVYDETGGLQRGAWPLSAEAHRLVGLPELELSAEATHLAHGSLEPYFPFPFTPGQGITRRVAALVPWPEVWRFALIFDPLDTRRTAEMAEKNSLGSNVAVWINAYDQVCRYGDIIPQPGQFSGFMPGGSPQPGQYVEGYLLARHPLSTYHIVRGFGCTSQWTGFKSSACPGEGWFHNGIDYGAPTGTTYYDTLPVKGTLLFAGPDDGPDCSYLAGSQAPHNGYGNFVKHSASEQGYTVVIWGGHLSAISITGDSTQPGVVLGAVGSTGCSTGPHLHFAVSVDGRFVDPEPLIPPGAP